MGLAGLLSLLCITATLLSISVASQIPPNRDFLEFAPEATDANTERQKRQNVPNQLIGKLMQKINDVEDLVSRTQNAVKETRGYLVALGVNLNSTTNTASSNRLSNPCNSDLNSGRMIWTTVEGSKCVRVISGLHTIFNATELCRQEHIEEEGTAHPTVLSEDSVNNVTSFLRYIRQHQGVDTVWVERQNISDTSSSGATCIEIQISESNSPREGLELKNVDCGVLNRVVCEKPLSDFPTGSRSRGAQVETEEERQKTNNPQLPDKVASKERTTLEDEKQTRSNLTGLFLFEAMDVLRAETKRRLESTKTNLQTLSDMDGRMRSVAVVPANEPEKKAPGIFGTSQGPWELGQETAFSVEQMTGRWFMIEAVGRHSKTKSAAMCDEFNFNLTGTSLQITASWEEPHGKRGKTDLWTVDTLSPHHWLGRLTWLKTDYRTWGIVLDCSNKNISSCQILYILSRKLTLKQDTLEMLRNVAEERGFKKSHGSFLDKSVC